ncbi:META domain-containing protein [Bradyrhizobium prioriisuperbiae]|uniref:META domain-containing protein n=1 Tax=Bradyrhizobium prioriisuperbiae TaxID=2854389 RepID=UPI0028F049A8|nr:META domain-containing protein [Bradyrhizobium prioritasuperba]
MTFSRRSFSALAACISISIGVLVAAPRAQAQDFPFGQEMTLDVRPLPGSKRVPSLEIGDRGETRIELWCKGGRGQFSVAGETIVFVPGAMEERACPPDKAQLDDALIATLSEATNWKRQGDYISFIGARTLRFHLNSN